MTKEHIRLQESRDRLKHWKRWGPYLSERAWGTVREDYSPDGTAWEYFPHDHARSRAYRWNEDGIAGICDRHQILCFSLAMWNGHDPILKERYFGLTGNEGNHGEDVKEYYFYVDSTPTHSYMKYLYKYPQAEYPYEHLLEENRKRTKNDPEYELLDTGIFDHDRYFDVFVEYAKADYEDICIKITVANRGPEAAPISLIPTLWFRNTWSWDDSEKPNISPANTNVLKASSPTEGGDHFLYFQNGAQLLFTENETNSQRLFGVPNRGYVKDAFHQYVVNGQHEAVNPRRTGTKAGLLYNLTVPSGGEVEVRLRLSFQSEFGSSRQMLGPAWEKTFANRKAEADEFYASVIPENTDADTHNIMRQAFAGLMWSKQFYHFVVRDWLNGDPAQPPPPEERKHGRNKAWLHLYNSDVISMPDKWEYPWYAAWDLAFHCIALALIDPDFAKEQLVLMLREWYMHPNGQMPAYEWAFGDVNPPVHAWATYAVYKIDQRMNDGAGDRQFLERVFHKLMLNFTWWVNRKDVAGQNVFQGGFLGLDNIGVFDRNAQLPTGGYIEQSDGTSWMAMYSLDMLTIALDLANEDPVYEDVASKFWEHFIYIATAMNNMGTENISLWNEEDGFFYDVLHLGEQRLPLRVRSMVGLIPLYACQTLEPELLDKMPMFKRRLEWFVTNRPDLTSNVASMTTEGRKQRRLLAIPSKAQLERILARMFDENEFLSPYGVRALSRYHLEHPFTIQLDGMTHSVDYEPAESTTVLFGGNSNWRGPIWMPVNYHLIRALRRYYHYYGDEFKVECPTGSGQMMNLMEASDEIARRVINIFKRNGAGERPLYGTLAKFQTDPHWRDYIRFHEYFHGDTGFGIGAAQQCGWTALVAKLITELSERYSETPPPKAASGTA